MKVSRCQKYIFFLFSPLWSIVTLSLYRFYSQSAWKKWFRSSVVKYVSFRMSHTVKTVILLVRQNTINKKYLELNILFGGALFALEGANKWFITNGNIKNHNFSAKGIYIIRGLFDSIRVFTALKCSWYSNLLTSDRIE